LFDQSSQALTTNADKMKTSESASLSHACIFLSIAHSVTADTKKHHANDGTEMLTPVPSAPGNVIKVRGQTRAKPFGVVSTLAVSMTLMATWEAICGTLGPGLVSGGPVSLVYSFISK